MVTVNRQINNAADKTMALRFIEDRPIPFTMTVTDGKHRTTKQNKLSRWWITEIAHQRDGTTA